MGHDELRHDTECQNCGYTVDVAYCSKCGQKNTETRQSFHHLITHFAEDLTHYDGAFWKTIKYLLFRPGKLTIEYLEGHRMRFVPPVKLYIFISFVTFFLMAVLAPEPEEEEHTGTHTTANVKKDDLNELEIQDGVFIHSLRELDSVNNMRPVKERMSKLEYNFYKGLVKANSENFSGRDLIITAAHTLPKVLFIYMPIFAFWLWIFHGKKRWYFFDHGIFTLHYFSFLLLTVTIIMVVSWGLTFVSDYLSAAFVSIAGLLLLLYSFFYFFRSHRKMYGETRTISRLKGFALFLINLILILIAFAATFFYIMINMH